MNNANKLVTSDCLDDWFVIMFTIESLTYLLLKQKVGNGFPLTVLEPKLEKDEC